MKIDADKLHLFMVQDRWTGLWEVRRAIDTDTSETFAGPCADKEHMTTTYLTFNAMPLAQVGGTI